MKHFYRTWNACSNGSGARPWILAALLMLPIQAFAGWFADNLIDPEDGMLDASEYLASAHGFLPVPIIITEPAVGFGLGAAVAYFHPPQQLDESIHPHHGPPSISVGFGAATENGTTFFGGGHLGIWKDDHIRYTGVLAKADVNLKFYGFDESDPGAVDDQGIKFNVEGLYLLQGMEFRLKESDWWLGLSYSYLSSNVRFPVFDELPPEIPRPDFSVDDAGLTLSIAYDGRNSFFTPTRGLQLGFEYSNHADTWGGDYDYDKYSAELQHFRPFGKWSSLGFRIRGEKIGGDAPFFTYPFVTMRGIPAMRYQGEGVVQAEAEFMWGLTPRWSLVFFGGIGSTSPVGPYDGEYKTVAAGGLGFRYRLARKMGLQTGLDVARGPEDTAVYVTVGNAWK